MSVIQNFAISTVEVLRPGFKVATGTKVRINAAAKPLSTMSFITFMIALFTASMMGVLMLQTFVAKGTFHKIELTQERNALLAERALLIERVAILESPRTLTQKAKELGMVSPERPTYLRLSDKKLLDGKGSR